MTSGKKIVLIVGIVTVGIGGFALTMYLTRKAYEKRLTINLVKSVDEIVRDYDVFN